jgi:predicted RNase H-like nuclease (RuvC/YqgF family)
MSEVQKESYVDEAKRRIAHLSYKLEEAEKKIKTLEYDNAELVRWTNDTCVPRLQELTDELVNRYNQKRYRGKNYNDLRWKEREEQRD